MKGLPLVDLLFNECRYSVGMQDGVHLFCAEAVKSGSPYCREHHALCHGERTPPPVREARSSDARSFVTSRAGIEPGAFG